MIFDPQIFYQTYLKEYHKIKAEYLKKLLDNSSKYYKDFFSDGLDEYDENLFKRTIKSDLRQTYFHAIETFFELLFALNPKGKETPDDAFVLFNLSNSNWKTTYEKIEKISKNEAELNFLDEKITFSGFDISIGHYLFYMGVFNKNNFPDLVFTEINESINAIKYGILIIAKDFVKRDEYNAYKHGIRLIPATSKVSLADTQTKKIIVELDMSDSVSFYHRTNKKDEIKVSTKVFDSERDFQMICFCSNLIHQLVYFRKISIRKESETIINSSVAIKFFSKDAIDKCSKANVQVNDVVYTVRKKPQ